MSVYTARVADGRGVYIAPTLDDLHSVVDELLTRYDRIIVTNETNKAGGSIPLATSTAGSSPQACRHP